MVVRLESAQEDRRRAAIDRLHRAQLVALARCPGIERDAYGAERHLLAKVGEMGRLLVQLAVDEADAAQLRLRFVALAVSSANILAELVGLAFDVESAGAADGEVGRGERCAAERRQDGGPSVREGGETGRAPTPLRAVTDANLLLVEQLKRLMEDGVRQESWRREAASDLWHGLLVGVTDMLPLIAQLEAGALEDCESEALHRLTAEAANYLAFLRFYPRLPKV